MAYGKPESGAPMQRFINEQVKDLTGFDPRHRWIKGTDVQHVRRKHGWVPPSEYRLDFKRHSASAQQAADRK